MFAALQYLLPHHLLCRLAYAVTRSPRPWLKNALIGAFVRKFAPDMRDALEPDPQRYRTFNDFFCRALRADARPLAGNGRQIISPCDGTLSISGRVQEGQLLQAKSHRYTLAALLADETIWLARLSGGLYATIYLAPYNYHRIHMPLSGRLSAAWHVPGRLFSVNASTAAQVPGLFARNERVVCAFEGEHGAFALVLVGALFVGSMHTLWHGEVTPARAAGARAGIGYLTPTTGAELWQPRGAELGMFNMGSTVILLLPPNSAYWEPALRPGSMLRVGQALGAVTAPATAI